MTLGEMAVLVGVKPDTLRMQIHRGALVGTKAGRDWVVEDAEAARYMRENAGKMGAASPRHSRIGNRHPRKKDSPSDT